MADTITTSRNLAVSFEWQDPTDTTTTKSASIKIPNPKSNLTESTIKTQINTALNNGLFIETTSGEVLTSDNLLTAATTDQTINNIDIGWAD